MTPEQKSTEHYRLAYECANRRINQGCKGIYCGNCPLNVSLYVADQREAVLIKTSAQIDAEKLTAIKNNESTKIVVYTLMFLAAIIFFVVKCSPDNKPISVSTAVMEEHEPISQPTQSKRGDSARAALQSVWPKVERVRSRLPSRWKYDLEGDLPRIYNYLDEWPEHVYDVTGDGEINCQDWTILTYCYYNRPDQALIMHNENPLNGMDHLFLYIKQPRGTGYYDVDTYRAYEPQEGMAMSRVWGSRYDSAFDINKTWWFLSKIKE